MAGFKIWWTRASRANSGIQRISNKMANLGLIDFKLGLYIKVNVNEGQKNL